MPQRPGKTLIKGIKAYTSTSMTPQTMALSLMISIIKMRMESVSDYDDIEKNLGRSFDKLESNYGSALHSSY